MKSSRFRLFILFNSLVLFCLLYMTVRKDIFKCADNVERERAKCIQNQSRIGLFRDKYPFLLDCQNKLEKWTESSSPLNSKHNYSLEAPETYRSIRISRAVIVFFPVENIKVFEPEFKWLYRSWIEMMSYEPEKWRTDLIIFLDYEKLISTGSVFFNEMGCKIENLRQSSKDSPMCTLIDYKPIRKRTFKESAKRESKPPENNIDRYLYFLNEVDIFKPETNQLVEYYKLINDSMPRYFYTDSILMAFEGFEYFKKAGYDFLIRSDMDVFLTPLFAKWLPLFCDDFYVGRGGYSSTFNSKRFKRIASNLGLAYAESNNLGKCKSVFLVLIQRVLN